jgi:DNA-binding response OmpR family regulator
MTGPSLNGSTTAIPRLLVVEDDPLVRTVCVRLLKMRHYEVDQVENGVARARAVERDDLRYCID